MTHRLTTNYAKNYCNRTLIIKVTVENVVKCFFGGHGVVARLRTRHAQYDFWAINILCILAVISCLHSTWKNRVMQCNEMTILTDFVCSIACFVVLTQNRSCGCTFHSE